MGHDALARVENVVQRRAGFRGDHPTQWAGEWQRLFMLLIEQAFGLQFGF